MSTRRNISPLFGLIGNVSPKPAFIGLACSAPMLKSGITTWFIFSCMTTALGVGFIGSSSVAGA